MAIFKHLNRDEAREGKIILRVPHNLRPWHEVQQANLLYNHFHNKHSGLMEEKRDEQQIRN
jgi:hypothetical protein